MNKFKFLILGILFYAMLALIGCNKDTQAPNIYVLDADGNILSDNQIDTTVLLFSIYIDPGVSVEDNVSDAADIILTNDVEDVLSTTTAGNLRRTGQYTINYTATDEASNTSIATREIFIENISSPFTGSYQTERTSSQLAETTYVSTVAADTRISGRLVFPKVYIQEIGGETSSFKINADLFSPEISTSFSESIAYMGLVSDTETPFFTDLTYEQAIDSILSFALLKIDAQDFTDDLGNSVQIAGREDGNLPLSRIEYLNGTKTITKIVLELNVTFNGVPDSQVVETYTPQ